MLFDLDGTLLDTAADIAHALNLALAKQGRGAFTSAQVRQMIGRGVPTLIERAFSRLGIQATVQEQAAVLQYFHEYYQALHHDEQFQTRAYPGVAEALRALAARGLSAGVVTNKPHLAAVTLLERVGLKQWLQVVVGGDSCAQRKPHPQPLLHALRSLEVLPARAVMVGDSQIDVQAARAAGLAIVCVPYGYNEGADPQTLPCDAFVDTLEQLPALLFG